MGNIQKIEVYYTDIDQDIYGWANNGSSIVWEGNAGAVDMQYDGDGYVEIGVDYIVFTVSSDCGTGVSWSLTSDGGVMTISGTGPMADYTDANYQPWASIRSDIETIVINEGVTSIGDHAFDNCESATSVSIPASVTSIGNSGFYYCTGISSLTIAANSSLETIDSYAFYCAGFASINIPASVTSIGDYAFDCSHLTSITLNGGATIGTDAFPSNTNPTNTTVTIADGLCLYNGTKVLSGDVTDMGDVNGKTLQPAVKITLPTGVTATGTGVINQTDETYAVSGTDVTIAAATGYIISNVNTTGADLTDNGDDTYTFTAGTTDVTVTATVLTNIVTQSNFFNYFDDNGCLLDNVNVPFNELIFQGNFTDTDLDPDINYITIDRPITITGDNAVLNNIGFVITGSDVTLDKVSVTYNAPNEAEAKAIFANGAENFTLTNSEIIFTGANPGEYHYRGLEVRDCDAAKIDKNTITATFPAVAVNWNYNGSIDQDLVLAVGIQGGNDVEFTNNRVTVNTDGGIGGYPTIDAVMVYSANDILIKGNDITHVDNTTGEDARYYYSLDIYSTTGTVEANNIILNTSTDIDRNGGAYPINLTGPFTVTVKDNNITAISKGPTVGICASNWNGPATLTVENNNIKVTGHITTGNWAFVAGIEAEIDMLEANNNTITVANGADYDDDNPVYGVSMASSYMAGDPSADIKDNNMTVDGKYAVYYTKAVNANVTGNTLIAHDLIGNDAVYIEDGDGNTVQDNLPEDMASIVTQSNFFDFFDDCGILRNTVTFDKLFFQGEFSDLAAGYVIIDKPITITGVGAVLNNMGFVIDSEGVTLDKMTLTATTSLGDLIYVGASNVDLTNLNISYIVDDDVANVINVKNHITDVNILNNTIYFESHATSDENLVTAINLDNVEDVIVDGNTITADYPSLSVGTYDFTYFMMGLCYVNPIRVCESYAVELTNNKVDVTVNSYVSSFPTVQALYIAACEDVLVQGNNFTMVDDLTPAGTPIYLYGVECGFSEGIEFIENNFDISTTGGKSGAGSVYAIQVATTEATFTGNTITCECNCPNIGIFSPYGFGPAKDLVIQENVINVTGLATGSNDFALISGIEIQTGYATISNNTIYVQNKGGYDDNYPVSGVSAIQYSASTLSFDIQDNDIYVPDGKYAVNMLYPPTEAIVTGNALCSHELTGDAAVYFKSGDNNTVENNLDAFVNMPKTGESTYNIPANVSSFKVHDDGGISGRYSSGCTGTLVLTAPMGYSLQLSGKIKTEKDNDYLTVYDGSDDQADVLINQLSSSVSGTETAIPTVISTGNVMTLYFCSNNSGSDKTEFDGLDLTVTLIYNLTETDGFTDAIATEIAGKPAQFTRSFTKDVASTICLPFGFTPDATEQGLFYKFNGVDGSWQVHMDANVTEIEANKPYMFKPAKTGNITFTGTIDENASCTPTPDADTNDWTFVGTYERINWDDASKWDAFNAIYAFVAKKLNESAPGSPGDFVRLNVGTSYTPAFRAIMKYSGSATARGSKAPAQTSLPDVLKVVIDNANGTTTEIGTIDTRTGEMTTGDWYSLDGRRLAGKPTSKGVYIHNGKKTVIKN